MRERTDAPAARPEADSAIANSRQLGIDVNLNRLHRVWQQVLYPVRPRTGLGALGQRDSADAMTRTLRTLKARLAAASRQARPGFMTLSALRDTGEIVDFVWDFVNDDAARLHGVKPEQLRGLRLRDMLGGSDDCASVFEQYRRVVEEGVADATCLSHDLNGLHDLYRHSAVRLGDGVAVSLTNVSALGRARSLQEEVLRLRAATWRSSERARRAHFST